MMKRREKCTHRDRCLYNLAAQHFTLRSGHVQPK